MKISNAEKIEQLKKNKDREDAIKFIQKMQNKDYSTQKEAKVWELCEKVVSFPFLVDACGWIYSDKWHKHEAENYFVEVERTLGAEIAWFIYCSCLAAYRDSERRIPEFLIDIIEMVLAYKAQVNELAKEKFGLLTLELVRRKAN